jgi:disulfide bond formation protein DsbB
MLKSKNLVTICLLVFNISVLSAAFYIEYILKVLPCSMCLYQRIPYYMATVTTVCFFIKIINFRKLILILISLSVLSLIISFYHVGIEQSLFDELGTCKDSLSSGNTIDLLKELNKKGIISCKEVSFKIFGLSLASINCIANLGLLLFYWLILRNEK